MTDGEAAGVAIGPATIDDIDPVTDMWIALAAGQRRHGSTLLAEENRDAVREWVARATVTGELLVAQATEGDANRAPVGFVAFSIERGGYERDRTKGTVSNLFVVRECRGDGVGSALLSAAERALCEAGAETVALEALADNERARAFYAVHGYEPHRVELTKSASPTEDETHSLDDTE